MMKKLFIIVFVLLVICLFTCNGWAVYTSSTTVSLIVTVTDQGSGMGAGDEVRFSNGGLTRSPVKHFYKFNNFFSQKAALVIECYELLHTLSCF